MEVARSRWAPDFIYSSVFLWILTPHDWGLSPLNDGEGEGVGGRGMETLMTLGEMNIILKAWKMSIVFFIILTFSKCLEPIEKWRKSSYLYRAFKGTTLILLPFKLEAN